MYQPRLRMGRMGFEVYSRNGHICGKKTRSTSFWDKTRLSDEILNFQTEQSKVYIQHIGQLTTDIQIYPMTWITRGIAGIYGGIVEYAKQEDRG